MCCRDMYNFLQAFLKGHPQFAHLPFFAVGESYAGHYIPAVTHKVSEGSGMLELSPSSLPNQRALTLTLTLANAQSEP